MSTVKKYGAIVPANSSVERYDREISVDNYGVYRASLVFTVPFADMERAILNVPPTCPLQKFRFLELDYAKVVGDEGEQAILQANYAGISTEESKRSAQIIPGISEDPIETHRRYSALTQDELKYIDDYLQNPKGVVTIYDLSSAGLELLQKKLKGIQAFINMGLTVRVTYYRRAGFARVRSIGKTGGPSINVGTVSGEWLYIPGEQDMPREGGVVKVVDEWRLSGPGGWDNEIYG